MKVKTTCVKMLSIFLVLSMLTACSGQQSSQSESSQSESSKSDQSSEKAPSDLSELENNIEMIIKTLNGPAVQAQEMQQSSGSTQSGQSNSGSPESQGSQENQSGGSQSRQTSQQGQSQQQSQSSGSKQQDLMTMIPQIVDKMHYQWNNLMPEAVKKGAKKDLINNFSTSLNNLSNAVTSKSKMNIMLAANKVYADIPDLYSLFQPKPSPEIKRVRYYSRSAILNALNANWTQASSDISNLKSVWNLYKNSLSKEHQEMANKLDLSIYELEKVVTGKNAQLVNIKGKVVLLNTEELEQASESKSGGQSGGEQSQAGGGQSGGEQSQSGSGQSEGGQTSSQ